MEVHMLLLVIIFLVSQIVVPMYNLCLKGVALIVATILTYLVTTIFVLWALFIAHNYIR
jgi:hypothetical protein